MTDLTPELPYLVHIPASYNKGRKRSWELRRGGKIYAKFRNQVEARTALKWALAASVVTPGGPRR